MQDLTTPTKDPFKRVEKLDYEEPRAEQEKPNEDQDKPDSEQEIIDIFMQQIELDKAVENAK